MGCAAFGTWVGIGENGNKVAEKFGAFFECYCLTMLLFYVIPLIGIAALTLPTLICYFWISGPVLVAVLLVPGLIAQLMKEMLVRAYKRSKIELDIPAMEKDDFMQVWMWPFFATFVSFAVIVQ